MDAEKLADSQVDHLAQSESLLTLLDLNSLTGNATWEFMGDDNVIVSNKQ